VRIESATRPVPYRMKALNPRVILTRANLTLPATLNGATSSQLQFLAAKPIVVAVPQPYGLRSRSIN
jgi:hypothetical protein